MVRVPLRGRGRVEFVEFVEFTKKKALAIQGKIYLPDLIELHGSVGQPATFRFAIKTAVISPGTLIGCGASIADAYSRGPEYPDEP